MWPQPAVQADVLWISLYADGTALCEVRTGAARNYCHSRAAKSRLTLYSAGDGTAVREEDRLPGSRVAAATITPPSTASVTKNQ